MPIWAPSSNSSSSRTPSAAAQNRDFNTGAYNIPNPSDDEDEQHESDDADATPTTSARRPAKPRVKMTLINSQTWKPIPWTFPPAKLRSKLKPYKKAEYTASNQHYLMLPDDELHGPIVSFESIPKQPGSRWNFWQVRNFFKRPQPMPEGTLIFIQIYRQQFQEEAAEDADAKTDSDTGASVVDAGSGAQDWAPEYGYRAGGGGQSSPADNPFTRW
ncbi:MAG: hypothetical protein M1825_005919 [Sarcosagium campestre]|nr:MAG: hypothetical protein M1825_005919 [Sarcosagium campestre]